MTLIATGYSIGAQGTVKPRIGGVSDFRASACLKKFLDR